MDTLLGRILHPLKRLLTNGRHPLDNNLETLCGGRDAILARMMEHPAMKKGVGVEQAMKAAANAVETLVSENVGQEFRDKLTEAVESYVLMNGERDPDNASDWDSGIDDVVEKLVEPYQQMVSADWIGKHTVDTRLHEEGEVEKLAKSFGLEVYKQVANGRKPGQLLAAVGIVQNDVAAYIAQQAEANAAGSNDDTESAVVSICKAILKTHGDDIFAVAEDLELACDDDDILAEGAAGRLAPGVNPPYVTANFRAYANSYGKDAVFELLNDVQASPEKYAETPEATAGKPAGRKRNGGKAATAQTPAAAPPAGDMPSDVIPAEALALMKEHANVNDRDMSAGVGVSRATFNNYANGKFEFKASAEQRAFLVEEIRKHRDGLSQALALLGAQ